MKAKFRKLDWLTEENINVQEKDSPPRWYDNDKQCASGSRLMRMNIVIDNLFSSFSTKSSIESTNIMKYSLNYLRNAGSIIQRNVNVKVLMEIYD
jgi:hypothetical protein